MPSGRTKISPKSGRGLGHVTPTIFGSTVGYPSDSLASCLTGGTFLRNRLLSAETAILCCFQLIMRPSVWDRIKCLTRPSVPPVPPIFSKQESLINW